MIRGVSAWIKGGFLVLVGLLVLTMGIEPLYTIISNDSAVQAQGWGGYADTIWRITLDVGIWVFAIGMFFVAAQFINRRQEVTSRRR